MRELVPPDVLPPVMSAPPPDEPGFAPPEPPGRVVGPPTPGSVAGPWLLMSLGRVVGALEPPGVMPLEPVPLELPLPPPGAAVPEDPLPLVPPLGVLLVPAPVPLDPLFPLRSHPMNATPPRASEAVTRSWSFCTVGSSAEWVSATT